MPLRLALVLISYPILIREQVQFERRAAHDPNKEPIRKTRLKII